MGVSIFWWERCLNWKDVLCHWLKKKRQTIMDSAYMEVSPISHSHWIQQKTSLTSASEPPLKQTVQAETMKGKARNLNLKDEFTINKHEGISNRSINEQRNFHPNRWSNLNKNFIKQSNHYILREITYCFHETESGSHNTKRWLLKKLTGNFRKANYITGYFRSAVGSICGCRICRHGGLTVSLKK